MAAAKNKPKFGRPAELTDAWLEKHKDHNTITVKHTVFKGTSGIEYQECRCYLCGKLARRVLREVTTAPVTMPKKRGWNAGIRPSKKKRGRPKKVANVTADAG
jgi:hypothetical protein